MAIYQHVLSTYAGAQKSGKKIDLPPSIDKIVQILQEIPDSQVVPVIQMVVTCEQDPRVFDAITKLFKDRGLTAKPAKASPLRASESNGSAEE